MISLFINIFKFKLIASVIILGEAGAIQRYVSVLGEVNTRRGVSVTPGLTPAVNAVLHHECNITVFDFVKHEVIIEKQQYSEKQLPIK